MLELPKTSSENKLIFMIGFLVVLIAVAAFVLSNVKGRQGNRNSDQSATSSASASPIPAVSLEEKYDNPFDKKSQYTNPFSDYKNPFDNIK